MMFGGMGDEMKFLEEKEFKFDVDNFIRVNNDDISLFLCWFV